MQNNPPPSSTILFSLFSSIEPLGAYTDSYISLTLPAGFTVHNISFIAVWCYAFNINFGQATFPTERITFSTESTVLVFPPQPPVVLESVGFYC